MKLQFNSNLDYQHDAINAIVNIFEGQDTLQTNFTVTQVDRDQQADIFSNQSDLGIGNKLDLLSEELLENVRNIQLKQGLKQTEQLASRDFTIEMEPVPAKLMFTCALSLN